MRYELRSFGSYDPDVVSRETGFECVGPSLTQQSFRDECDINTIVERFGLGADMPEALPPRFGDFSEVTDFHSAMNAVRIAGEGFMLMPAAIRARFENDPARLIKFLEDPGNFDEAVKLGIVNAPPAPPSDKQGAPLSAE